MSSRVLIFSRPNSKNASRSRIQRSPRPSLSRAQLATRIQASSHLNALLIPKPSVTNVQIPSSTIFCHKTPGRPSNASISPIIKKKSSSKGKRKKTRNGTHTNKLSLRSKSIVKTENLRYHQRGFKNSDSEESFNGVSTPPEEVDVNVRSISPFSDILDKQLCDYINSSPTVGLKLEIPNKGYIEDSYQYSTAESRKRESYKFSFEKNLKFPEPPKTPPPFSIYSKINKLIGRRQSVRNYPTRPDNNYKS